MRVFKKLSITVLILLLFSGCTTLEKETPESVVQEEYPFQIPELQKEMASPDTSPELQNIDGEILDDFLVKKGIVIAKTDFQGVLENRYVKLLFVDQEDPSHHFQLHIGKTDQKNKFSWQVKTVDPGYFFVELPAGQYKIVSVSIPVGSTMATEPVDVDVKVASEGILYVGTLKIVGTKEKIKLGGVPLIKPGFEYEMEIIDDRDEGIAQFKNRYPNITSDIIVELMKMNMVDTKISPAKQ